MLLSQKRNVESPIDTNSEALWGSGPGRSPKAIGLMLKQPSMIKRPVLDAGGGKFLVGFDPETYRAALTTR